MIAEAHCNNPILPFSTPVVCWLLRQSSLWHVEDTDLFSFSFALNTSSRLLWGSMAFARKVTDFDISWHFLLCISNHWVLSSALSFFSSELLKGRSKKKEYRWPTWVYLKAILVTSPESRLVFFLFWSHLRHMEVPRPGIKSEMLISCRGSVVNESD